MLKQPFFSTTVRKPARKFKERMDHADGTVTAGIAVKAPAVESAPAFPISYVLTRLLRDGGHGLSKHNASTNNPFLDQSPSGLSPLFVATSTPRARTAFNPTPGHRICTPLKVYEDDEQCILATPKVIGANSEDIDGLDKKKKKQEFAGTKKRARSKDSEDEGYLGEFEENSAYGSKRVRFAIEEPAVIHSSIKMNKNQRKKAKAKAKKEAAAAAAGANSAPVFGENEENGNADVATATGRNVKPVKKPVLQKSSTRSSIPVSAPKPVQVIKASRPVPNAPRSTYSFVPVVNASQNSLARTLSNANTYPTSNAQPLNQPGFRYKTRAVPAAQLAAPVEASKKTAKQPTRRPTDFSVPPPKLDWKVCEKLLQGMKIGVDKLERDVKMEDSGDLEEGDGSDADCQEDQDRFWN